MTKQCPQCNRTLELNTTNFRCGSDGYWRRLCRDCQNKLGRCRYKEQAANRPKLPNPYKLARQRRLQAQIEKYEKVTATLEACGLTVNSPAVIADIVLANASMAKRKSA